MFPTSKMISFIVVPGKNMCFLNDYLISHLQWPVNQSLKHWSNFIFLAEEFPRYLRGSIKEIIKDHGRNACSYLQMT